MSSSTEAWNVLAQQDTLWLTQTQSAINAYLPFILLSHTKLKILENYILHVYIYMQYIFCKYHKYIIA